jgi:hypothetical protein
MSGLEIITKRKCAAINDKIDFIAEAVIISCCDNTRGAVNYEDWL